MIEQNLIALRIEEVKAESERLRARLAEIDGELEELESAASVISRLMGVGRKKISPAKATAVKEGVSEKKSNIKPDGLPTMPELIIMAIRHEKRPMTPREITDVIRRNWWPTVDGQKIGSIVWRLNKRNDIEKVDGTSTYRMPQTNEPSDENLGGSASEGSLFSIQAKGREAVPGGGP